MQRSSFNADWEWRPEGDDPSMAARVTLPHDAMHGEERTPDAPGGHHTGFYPGGVYRYTKRFDTEESWRNRVVMLEFEGVYHRSEIFLNGELVGGRPSGYVSFFVDITDALNPSEENELVVIAHNDDQPNSRWYTGSGIYRPVHLLLAETTHIAPAGARISTSALTTSDAQLLVEVPIIRRSPEQAEVTVVVSIETLDGEQVGGGTQTLFAVGDAVTTAAITVAVQDPSAWSPEQPTLHVARVTVSTADGLGDQSEHIFGIRTVSANAKTGLLINGDHVWLRGACVHHDSGVIGAATFDVAEDRRVQIMKAAGFNAIRSSHNPISSALLRACDRHGMLVMDELADSWYRTKVPFDYAKDFDAWWERDLTAMIERDFNHPSVIMYSIGNEIAETSQPRGVELGKELSSTARRLDPSRLVTNGVNLLLNIIASDDQTFERQQAKRSRKGDDSNIILIINLLMNVLQYLTPPAVRSKRADRKTVDAFSALDVAGYNYGSARYKKDFRLYPDRVMVGTETQSSELREVVALAGQHPQLIGDFVWTGWDYIGEAGIGAQLYGQRPKLNQPYPGRLAGMTNIDITGHLQTQTYVNQITWGLRTGPVLAVQPVNRSGERTSGSLYRYTNSLRSWSWDGCEGRTATVEVYCDAQTHRIELFLNGRAVGKQTKRDAKRYLTLFELPYEPGTLTAVSYRADGTEIGRDTLASAASTIRLTLRPEAEALIAGEADLLYVPIELTDRAGTVKPLADRELSVTVTGNATLLGFGSAAPITADGFSTGKSTTYNGRALAVLRAGATAGNALIRVDAADCETVECVIPVIDPASAGTHQR